MARIKFGSIITDSRGSIGGHTIKWTRAGLVIQQKATPSRRLTARASTVRNHFANFTRRWWNELDVSQRTDWRALAAANPRPDTWGTEFPLTGLALYVGVNQLLTQAGQSSTDTAPSDQVVTSPLTATPTLTAPNTASLAFTATPVPADHVAVLFATRPLSPGIENPVGNFAFLTASGSGQTSPWAIGSTYVARFGTLPAGRQVFFSLHFLNTDNGAQSPGVISSALIAP